MNITEITNASFEHAAGIFHALAHDIRLKICCLLIDGQLSVSEICTKLNVPQHRVSQQLALLRSAGLVVANKKSRQVFYSLANVEVRKIIEVIFKEYTASSPSDQNSDDLLASPHQEMASDTAKPTMQKLVIKKPKSFKSFEAGRFSEIL